MSRQSIATTRRQPVAATASVRGTLSVHGETFTVETSGRIQIVDVTEAVMARVHALPIREGTATLCSMHTTCTLFINEYQRALVEDFKTFLAGLVADEAAWLHNDPDHSDCDRLNADAHLRALLLGHSVTLPVSGGEVVLGTWQRVLMGELDGGRVRSLRLQVMGVA
jgi:secondary thiamine-phosphate synthase enzyme